MTHRSLPWLAALLAASLFSCGDKATSAATASSGAPAAATAPADGPTPPGVLRGTIDLAPALAGDLQQAPETYDCVFLMGRRGGPDGKLEIVERYAPVAFPMSFELSARNLLGVGTLSGTWAFTARLDADGEARGRPGDVEGDVVASVEPGAAPTRILLDRPVTEVSEPIDVSGPVAHGGGMTAESGMPGMSGMSGMSGTDGLPPGHPAIGDGLPAGHPPLGDGGQPYGGMGGAMAGGDEGTEAGAGPRIKGTLELGDAFADDNGKLTLFVYLKNNDGDRGMPWAALRFDQARFPMALDIGPEDVTLQIENKADLLTAGELWLHARLDLDGNAMTKEPGCIQAEPIKVSADSEPFTLVLDTRRGS